MDCTPSHDAKSACHFERLGIVLVQLVLSNCQGDLASINLLLFPPLSSWMYFCDPLIDI